MNMPGFTAEASLYKTSGRYQPVETRAISLSAIPQSMQKSPNSAVRKIADVIFAFTNRNTDVTEKFFVRVDVTEEFPFLVTKMSPYYDR